MPMPGMDPDRLRRPRDLKTWPLCGFPRAGPRAPRLPFPRRRRDPSREPSSSSMPPPTPTWHPPTIPDPNVTPLLADTDTSPTTPSPSPPPAATRPSTSPLPLLVRPPAPPPPPLLLNSTRDPRPHRSGRLRHVKGMLGLRRMETIDEDDGMLASSSDVDGDSDGEEEVRGRQRSSIHGGEDYAAGEGGPGGGGGNSGSAYASFPHFDSMSRLRRGMMVQFYREDEGSLQGVASSSSSSSWDYPPRKAARLF